MLWQVRAIGVVVALSWVTSSNAILAQKTLVALQSPTNLVTRGSADSILQQRVTIDLDDVPLTAAIDRLSAMLRRPIAYGADAIASGHSRVSVHVRAVAALDALETMLQGTGLTARLMSSGEIVLVPATPNARPTGQAGATIKGHVTDAATGEPLTNATVRITGTRFSTLSDLAGRYSLAGVPAGTYSVVAKMLGHGELARSVTVTADTVYILDFSLAQLPTTLGTVVTTATGEQQLSSLSNSIGVIDAKSLVGQTAVTDLTELISGRLSSVQVYETGGVLGVDAPMTIRGLNSVSLSNEPILYIDGVRVDNQTGFAGGYDPHSVNGGNFNDISPEEIESIEVAKGPAATTLYGTNAANGVILIKTKRGQAGQPRWQIHASDGLITTDRSRFQDSYHVFGHAPGIPGTPVQCLLPDQASQSCVVDSVSHFSPYKVSSITPIGTGELGNFGAQVSGGNSLRYFLSGGYESETGYLQMPERDRQVLTPIVGQSSIGPEALRPNATEKWSTRDNLVAQLNDALALSVSAGFVGQTIRAPTLTAAGGGEPNLGYRDSTDGWFLGRPGIQFLPRRDRNPSHLTIGATPTWTPTPWLNAHGTAGLDYASEEYNALTSVADALVLGQSSRTNAQVVTSNYTFDGVSTASFHPLSFLSSRTSIGGQYQRTEFKQTVATAVNLLPGCQEVGCGVPSSSESNTTAIIAGAFAEQMFGFNDRLSLTAALRADGSSTFGGNFSTKLYPKLGASWLVSGEPFWPHVPGLSSVRLRAAYGESGVQPPPTARVYQENVSPAFVDGQLTTGTALAQFGNPNIKPEVQAEFETGADLEFLGGRIQLQGTYYMKHSRDAIYFLPLPVSLGGGTVVSNIGAVRNWGYEGQVTFRIVDSRAVEWDVSANGSVNHNQVLSLGPDFSASVTPGTSNIVVGRPINSYYDYPFSYSDKNHDGVIEADEVNVGTTPAYRGPSYPGIQITPATSFTLFQRLRVSATFDYRGAFRILNTDELVGCYLSSCRELTVHGAPLYDQASAQAALNALPSFWGYFEDGSFTRFRELSIGYTLPPSWARVVRSHSVEVVLAARNIALWSKYRGVDPEVNTLVGVAATPAYSPAQGIPLSQYWVLRLNLGL